MGFTPTPKGRIAEFAAWMRATGVEVAVRRSRGLDIAAACGQLRVEKIGRRALPTVAVAEPTPQGAR